MFLFGVNSYEYSLVLLVGIFAGIATIASSTEDLKISIRYAFKTIYMSIYITTICYFLLTIIEIDYLFKIGISSLIGFLGIDKALELIKKVIHIKNG